MTDKLDLAKAKQYAANQRKRFKYAYEFPLEREIKLCDIIDRLVAALRAMNRSSMAKRIMTQHDIIDTGDET